MIALLQAIRRAPSVKLSITHNWLASPRLHGANRV
jgi:hypothetical protein